MTVGMNMMNTLFRDFKVAEDVGKMMSLRRFEVEFTVYGCLFARDGKRQYLISDDEANIYDAISQQGFLDYYPLPIVHLTNQCLVPSGCEEDICQQTKLQLAKYLQSSYSYDFLTRFYKLADIKPNNEAEPLLALLAEKLWGRYHHDWLTLFQGLVDRAYCRKNLNFENYCKHYNWIQMEQRQMDNDGQKKEQFVKILYGMGYQGDDSTTIVYLNADKNMIDHLIKTKRRQGYLTSTLLAKTYGYNYDYRLEDARKDFKKYLQKIFNEHYFMLIKELEHCVVAIDLLAYQSLLHSVQANGNRLEQEALEQYGCYWGCQF